METEIKVNVPRQKTWHEHDIKGRYRLLYKVTNSQGIFGGFHLPVYANPFTKQKTFLKNADGLALNGHLIDRPSKMLDPDLDPNIKYLVSWLICHPQVRLEGFPKEDIDEKILSTKKGNTKVKLVCMDHQESAKFEQEDFQDKLIGILSLDLGKNMISLAKSRYLLAYLNMPYRDPRFADSEISERRALRSKLKTHVRASYENAVMVQEAIDNLEEAQRIYEFKELVRLKILNLVNGLYKFQNATLGTSYDSVNAFFENHPEVRAEALSILYKE